MAPLSGLLHWAPFHLDALGLVTLLGAEEVSIAVGALENAGFSEYLPLFGTYLIAENKFARPIPGYSLTNITDGIYVPVVNGWFSRWVASHVIENVTALKWEVRYEDGSSLCKEKIFAILFGLFVHGGLIVFSVLQRDYYGFANALVMLASVFVRWEMVRQNRNNLNRMVKDGVKKTGGEVKIIVTTPDNKIIAFKLHPGLINCLLADLDRKSPPQQSTVSNRTTSQGTNARSSNNGSIAQELKVIQETEGEKLPSSSRESETKTIDIESAVAGQDQAPHDRRISSCHSGLKRFILWQKISKAWTNRVRTLKYTCARALGWLAFAVHVIAIGLSSLPTQMISVAILLISTLIVVYHVGNDSSQVGRRLNITVDKKAMMKRHKEAFLYLNPTKEERKVLKNYLLLPYRMEQDAASQGNKDWWEEWDKDIGIKGI